VRKKSMRHIMKARGEKLAGPLRGIELDRVLVVPIDVAKRSSRALVANYLGEVLVEPFTFEHTRPGVDLLVQRVEEAGRKTCAARVYVAMESTGHYGELLAGRLRQTPWQVLQVNPYAVKTRRSGSLGWCKTDDLDLCAIGSLVIDSVASEAGRVRGTYYNLRLAARARRDAVRRVAALKTQIRCLLDRLFPGLDDIEGLKNLDAASTRTFLRCVCTPQRALAMGERRLAAMCRRRSLPFGQEKIAGIVRTARTALSKEPPEQEVLRELLEEKLAQIEDLGKTIVRWEIRMASYLACTPGPWLLRVNYVGVTSAAEFMAETADPASFAGGASYVRYAGMEPRRNQSGAFQASTEPITRCGSSRCRNIVMLIAQAIGCHNAFFRAFASRLVDRGKPLHVVKVAVGCKFLKLAHPIMILRHDFRPPDSFRDCFCDDIEKKMSLYFRDRRALDVYKSISPVVKQALKAPSNERRTMQPEQDGPHLDVAVLSSPIVES